MPFSVPSPASSNAMSQHAATLFYGYGQELELKLDSERLLADCTPRGDVIADIGPATKTALESALEHPNWSQTVYPGDRVVIGVDGRLPQAVEILDAVIEATTAAGVSAEDITLLFPAASTQATNSDDDNFTPEEVSTQTVWEQQSRWAGQVKSVAHDPQNRSELAYLAATEEGDPMVVNRSLADADVVMLVSVTRDDASLGYCGVNGLLCHTFGDADTMKRFRTFHAGQSKPQTTRWTHAKSKEAAWSLGANFCLQVVPGVNGQIIKLIGGKNDAVAAAAQQAYQDAWRYRIPAAADLVVAAIDLSAVSWLDLASAANMAARLVNTGGAFVLLTDFREPAGKAMRRLAEVEAAGDALKSLRTDSSEDVVAAVGLANVLERCRVYLVSQLDEDECQALHFVHVDDPDDIQRLVARCESCVLIPAAQFADVDLEAPAN